MCVYHHSWDTEYFHRLKDPLYCLYVDTSLSFLLPLADPTLNAWQTLICLHFYNVVISWKLYKWSNTVCKLWGMTFSLSTIIWLSFQIVCVSRVCSFHCWEVLYGMEVPQFVWSLTCWRTFGLFPVSRYYEHEQLCIGFCVYMFLFLWNEDPRM